MNRHELIQIAESTREITKQGFYYDRYGRRVELGPTGLRSRYAVDLYSPEELVLIAEDDDEFFARAFNAPRTHDFYLVDADSFEAASSFVHPLVMNFANAHTPGGGFLHGARAQEECLCRTSTLYASISSEKARTMYDYNRALRSPVDSDYILISPNVFVFRNRDNELLDEPFHVGVATIAAPNRNGAARNVPQEELDAVMKGRLRKFLYAAARAGYSSLILGAWGCGAFGHDPERVAGYFRELFFVDGMEDYFKAVAFAIPRGCRNYEAFKAVLGDQVDVCEAIPSEPTPGYVEAKYPVPICNHTAQVGKENLGYTQGVLSDGTPFEAELWENSIGTRSMSILLPERPEFCSEERSALNAGNVTGIQWQHEKADDCSILPLGMVIREESLPISELEAYTAYLERMGLLHFVSPLRNGCLRALTDTEGHDLIWDIVTLSEDGELRAETPLTFRPFPNQPERQLPKSLQPNLMLIRGGGSNDQSKCNR